jgi:hypothetical protein
VIDKLRGYAWMAITARGAAVQFPLESGGRSVGNATECRAQYSAIFNKTVVDAIAAQQFEACSSTPGCDDRRR